MPFKYHVVVYPHTYTHTCMHTFNKECKLWPFWPIFIYELPPITTKDWYIQLCLIHQDELNFMKHILLDPNHSTNMYTGQMSMRLCLCCMDTGYAGGHFPAFLYHRARRYTGFRNRLHPIISPVDQSQSRTHVYFRFKHQKQMLCKKRCDWMLLNFWELSAHEYMLLPFGSFSGRIHLIPILSAQTRF